MRGDEQRKGQIKIIPGQLKMSKLSSGKHNNNKKSHPEGVKATGSDSKTTGYT